MKTWIILALALLAGGPVRGDGGSIADYWKSGGAGSAASFGDFGGDAGGAVGGAVCMGAGDDGYCGAGGAMGSGGGYCSAGGAAGFGDRGGTADIGSSGDRGGNAECGGSAGDAAGFGDRGGSAGGADKTAGGAILLVDWNLENFFDYREDGGAAAIGGRLGEIAQLSMHKVDGGSRVGSPGSGGASGSGNGGSSGSSGGAGGSGSSDSEFTPLGARHWTKQRFYAKCSAVAKTLFLIADAHGRLPDIICMQEIENAFVLKQLLYSTPLRKLDYRIVHFDSPDRRGIDCALLYRSSRLCLLDAAPAHLFSPAEGALQRADSSDGAAEARGQRVDSSSSAAEAMLRQADSSDGAAEARGQRAAVEPRSACIMPTRDILVCCFGLKEEGGGNRAVARGSTAESERSRTEDGSDAGGVRRLAVLVNHHPSKVGGDSDSRRWVAMERMKQLCDSLQRAGQQSIVCVGDFNDNVWQRGGGQEAISIWDRCSSGSGKGTIKYNGAWEKIDGFFALGPLQVEESVFDHPLLSTADKAFGGTKPLRCYSGPRYLGGISDHYPIVLEISIH